MAYLPDTYDVAQGDVPDEGIPVGLSKFQEEAVQRRIATNLRESTRPAYQNYWGLLAQAFNEQPGIVGRYLKGLVSGAANETQEFFTGVPSQRLLENFSDRGGMYPSRPRPAITPTSTPSPPAPAPQSAAPGLDPQNQTQAPAAPQGNEAIIRYLMGLQNKFQYQRQRPMGVKEYLGQMGGAIPSMTHQGADLQRQRWEQANLQEEAKQYGQFMGIPMSLARIAQTQVPQGLVNQVQGLRAQRDKLGIKYLMSQERYKQLAASLPEKRKLEWAKRAEEHAAGLRKSGEMSEDEVTANTRDWLASQTHPDEYKALQGQTKAAALSGDKTFLEKIGL